MTREQEIAMERCADFLARIIMKYGAQFIEEKCTSKPSDETISASDKGNPDPRRYTSQNLF